LLLNKLVTEFKRLIINGGGGGGGIFEGLFSRALKIIGF
jgi:hypothetical protein